MLEAHTQRDVEEGITDRKQKQTKQAMSGAHRWDTTAGEVKMLGLGGHLRVSSLILSECALSPHPKLGRTQHQLSCPYWKFWELCE